MVRINEDCSIHEDQTADEYDENKMLTLLRTIKSGREEKLVIEYNKQGNRIVEKKYTEDKLMKVTHYSYYPNGNRKNETITYSPDQGGSKYITAYNPTGKKIYSSFVKGGSNGDSLVTLYDTTTVPTINTDNQIRNLEVENIEKEKIEFKNGKIYSGTVREYNDRGQPVRSRSRNNISNWSYDKQGRLSHFEYIELFNDKPVRKTQRRYEYSSSDIRLNDKFLY